LSAPAIAIVAVIMTSASTGNNSLEASRRCFFEIFILDKQTQNLTQTKFLPAPGGGTFDQSGTVELAE
jgi:hypothetical protein